MEIASLVERLISGESLSEETAGAAISSVMSGELTPVQIAALLTAFRCKGETVDEITGAAKAMRSHAAMIPTEKRGIVDTCGTGGDRSGTFNISTTAALVVAAAGVPVAKHGNRSATSRCGSIDLFERLGVNVMMTAEQATRCLEAINLTVLFARVVHPAMKYAAPIRSELGFRTIFNFLGPMTNPAKPAHQLVGISDVRYIETYASCLQRLGSHRSWVVSGSDGLDEITLTGPTTVMEIDNKKMQRFEITPEEAGIKRCSLEDLKGGTPEENTEITLAIVEGREKGPKRDAVRINAGATLFLAGKADSLQSGATLAGEILDSGKAKAMLEKLIEVSNLD